MSDAQVVYTSAIVAFVVASIACALVFALGFGVGVALELRKRPRWTAPSATRRAYRRGGALVFPVPPAKTVPMEELMTCPSPGFPEGCPPAPGAKECWCAKAPALPHDPVFCRPFWAKGPTGLISVPASEVTGPQSPLLGDVRPPARPVWQHPDAPR